MLTIEREMLTQSGCTPALLEAIAALPIRTAISQNHQIRVREHAGYTYVMEPTTELTLGIPNDLAYLLARDFSAGCDCDACNADSVYIVRHESGRLVRVHDKVGTLPNLLITVLASADLLLERATDLGVECLELATNQENWKRTHYNNQHIILNPAPTKKKKGWVPVQGAARVAAYDQASGWKIEYTPTRANWFWEGEEPKPDTPKGSA